MGTEKHSAVRGGFIIFRHFGTIIYPILWSPSRLRRVARSSATAEILSAADAMDKPFHIPKLLFQFYIDSSVELGTDSHELFNFVCTDKQLEESANKINFATMRSFFENGTLRSMFWIPEHYMFADALTNGNRQTAALLNRVLCEGVSSSPGTNWTHNTKRGRFGQFCA